MGVALLGNGKYRLQIRRRGYPRIDKVFASEEEALAAEIEFKGKHEKRLMTISSKATMGELWVRYVDSLLFSSKALTTQKTEVSRIKPVLAYLGAYSLEVLEADKSLIYDYIDERAKYISVRTKAKLSESSLKLEIEALSSLVAYAKHRGLVKENFVTGISRPRAKRRKRRIPSAELGKVAISARDCHEQISKASCFVLLVRHLGCRPGELARLRVDDINLHKTELTFRDTKNREDRCIHITGNAMQILHLQLPEAHEGSPYLFSTKSRKGTWVPYNYSYGIKVLRQFEIVGQDFYPHAGRREFISRAIEASLPLTTIKKQTGHKSTQALEIYDEGLSTAADIRAEFDRLAVKVKEEQLSGAFEAMGLTEWQKQKVVSLLSEDGWISVDGKNIWQ